ncbi:MAG: Asp-tRNA(Asn)/Glu-tRNA(Gln) amidotransferase subunit GatA [bacterium]|nr:Asp-tRNA(Asn)/Glu-tRNA(Gln) amidotransferase subunit GatA [bacterium]
MENLTIKQASELLHKKEISARELAQAYLLRAEEKNPQLNAYLEITNKAAMQMADEADRLIERRDSNVLTGIPFAIKDNILVKGVPATAGSKILQNYTATYDATVTEKLKEAGAVIMAKTNMDEFAMGSSTENSAFGPAKNPHDTSRAPGGSSGGSAAAVAADMCVAALGSDTGGSIRQPAAFCGIVGLKPTYGRVSRSGLIAMASSLDQIGPMTKTAWDAAALLECIAGHNSMDATTSPVPATSYTKKLTGDIKGLRIGIPNEYFGDGLDANVEKSVREAIFALERLGATIGGATLPHTPYGLPVYYVLMPSEVSSNLARFDGIRYGYSAASPYPAGGEGRGELEAKTLLDVYTKSRGLGFGKEVKRRIMLGTYALSAGYYDAYYKKAQQIRTLIIEDFRKAFEEYDVLVSPTTPTPAFKLGEKEDPVSLYLADVYTVSANIAGVPAISIPCGTAERDGVKLPIGLQIMGRHFDEETILRVADAYERFVGGKS